MAFGFYLWQLNLFVLIDVSSVCVWQTLGIGVFQFSLCYLLAKIVTGSMLIEEYNSLPSNKHLTFIENSLNLFIVEFAKFCGVA